MGGKGIIVASQLRTHAGDTKMCDFAGADPVITFHMGTGLSASTVVEKSGAVPTTLPQDC